MKQPEVWMRGPVHEVPALLQPVAHALLQVSEELDDVLNGFDDRHLWTKPAGMASVGFHLQHLRGVLDRLFTYAQGKTLNADQFAYLERESVPNNDPSRVLVQRFREQVDKALTQLRNTTNEDLLAQRGIGRKQIPTNVLGLLFHAAEHTQRHLGQLLVTAGILRNGHG